MEPRNVEELASEIASYPDRQFKEWVMVIAIPEKNPDGSMKDLKCGIGPADMEGVLRKINLTARNKFSAGELFRFLFSNNKWPTAFRLTPRRKRIITQGILCWKLGAEILGEIRAAVQSAEGESFNTQRITERPNFQTFLDATIPLVTFTCSLIANSCDERHIALYVQVKQRYEFFREVCRAFHLFKPDLLEDTEKHMPSTILTLPIIGAA